MTPDQQAALRTAARANPACAALVAAKDCRALALLLSNGRTRPSATEIGYGTILEVIGIAAGNQLIDFIKGNPELRHVVPLLEQGRLRIGSPVTQAAVQSFVGAGAVAQADADTLCALGREPAPLTAAEVEDALFYKNGTEK
ncbi:hypothetical protein QPK31_24075 [Massilia sp. YIM B02769]|uniref:hypothetical protein n=1 Tax=Massilia sp. YIM B02769 TaxID=3050129 RepID=UPI0025B6F3D6|nr:hypothetical protein [Massilia sp. YIM B02769]MDN4061302.1 hypothetical protein [Massilia sp. YIM B02769]